MNSVPKDDIEYLTGQSISRINMILSGMTSLINDTDNKVKIMESQDWFKRMLKTVTGKNKATQAEIRQNHDKLNAYMSQAICELYNRNCIENKIIMSLGTQLNELYIEHLQLKQMLGAFVSRLNEKIDSIDNFHMLTTELDQGVYSSFVPIVAILKIISQFDKRILQDSRKMDILKRSMIKQNIINNQEIQLSDYLMNIIEIPMEEIGEIYLELSTIRSNFMANIILNLIEKYHFLPDIARKVKNKNSLIEEVINDEKLDGTIQLSISDIYNDFINSKINIQNELVTVSDVQEEFDLEEEDRLYIDGKLYNDTKLYQQEKDIITNDIHDIYKEIKLYCRDVVLRVRDESKNYSKFHVANNLRYHLGIKDSDEVYLGHDDTIFKNGKIGFAITNDGIFSREMFGSKHHIEFKELNNISNFYWKNATLYGDEYILAICATGSDFDKDVLIELFKFIKKLVA